MMVSFCAVLFPRGVLDEILNLIESVSEGFPYYFYTIYIYTTFHITNFIGNIIHVDEKQYWGQGTSLFRPLSTGNQCVTYLYTQHSTESYNRIATVYSEEFCH